MAHTLPYPIQKSGPSDSIIPKNGPVPTSATSILARSKVLAAMLHGQSGPSIKSEKIHINSTWANGNNVKESNPPSLLPAEIWTPSFIRENRDFHGQKFISPWRGGIKIRFDACWITHSSFYQISLSPFFGKNHHLICIAGVQLALCPFKGPFQGNFF
jgi:hypothetical protein